VWSLMISLGVDGSDAHYPTALTER
jgi:hypothetical protein